MRPESLNLFTASQLTRGPAPTTMRAGNGGAGMNVVAFRNAHQIANDALVDELTETAGTTASLKARLIAVRVECEKSRARLIEVAEAVEERQRYVW